MTNKKTKKPTKRDYFNALLGLQEVASKTELVDFIEHELELLDRKNNPNREPSEKEKEKMVRNERLRDVLVEVLSEQAEGKTITELMKMNAELGESSTSNLTWLLGGLIEDGIVQREMVKRRSLYSIVK